MCSTEKKEEKKNRDVFDRGSGRTLQRGLIWLRSSLRSGLRSGSRSLRRTSLSAAGCGLRFTSPVFTDSRIDLTEMTNDRPPRCCQK
jgi:hypothetical protein